MASSSEDVLVLNSGSSSLKFAVYRPGPHDEDLVLEGSAEGIGRGSGSLHVTAADGSVLLSREHVLKSREVAFQALVDCLLSQSRGRLAGIGHRIVHGGPRLREHQELTPAILRELASAKHFAPLHIPAALSLIRLSEQAYPGVRQFGCFDTAFHRTMPEIASHLPLPSRFYQEGVIRYGFHGLSYESIVHRLGAQLPERVILAHLGNGASVTAVRGGRSVDTSMGFTPTGGVPMGTRSGDLDPGTLLYIMRTENLGVDELELLVNQESGLTALSNGESDMRLLLQGSAAGNPAMKLALEAFCTAVKKQIGAYAALLGGVDLLVFTGGIGEHAAEVRQRICAGLEFLGLGAPSERAKVMTAEEDLQIARHTRGLLQSPA